MGMIDSVREAIGDQAAAMLVKSFGGRKVYVPLAATERHSIGRAIGAKAAAALSRRFGGEYIEVPNLQRRGGRNRSVLEREIRALAAQDIAHAEIARQLGCSRQWVGKVMRRDA